MKQAIILTPTQQQHIESHPNLSKVYRFDYIKEMNLIQFEGAGGIYRKEEMMKLLKSLER